MTEKLVRKAKKGDKKALVKLIMNEKDSYFKLAYVYMKNEEDAADALEDMIVVLFEKITTLQKDSSFYSWSKTILVNICKKNLKDKKKTVSIEDFEFNCVTESEDDRINEKIHLEKCLEKLSVNGNEIIRLRYYLDLEYSSISDILEIPLGTVKSRLSNAITKLRTCMEAIK